MAELTPDIVADVVEACKKGADEAAEAIGRALDCPGAKVAVGEPTTIKMDALPETLAGPGLVVVLTVGKAAALAILPESSGLTPPWCANPDPTGQSKLTTLAQELGMVLLPEALMPEDFKAGYVKDLSAALTRAGVANGAVLVSLGLALESETGVLSLVWPAATPAAVFEKTASPPSVEQPKPVAKPQLTPKPPSPAAEAKPIVAAARTPQAPSKAKTLPPYSQSLLKIRVPVVVTLAEKRQPIGRILELGPGSIIQFDKSCEEMLDLQVGNHRVANGEAVKVGEKFGLRITSMVLPDERFQAVGGKR
jgi:flagellar motor switch protein FliN